jgi:hypothetical protein
MVWVIPSGILQSFLWFALGIWFQFHLQNGLHWSQNYKTNTSWQTTALMSFNKKTAVLNLTATWWSGLTELLCESTDVNFIYFHFPTTPKQPHFYIQTVLALAKWKAETPFLDLFHPQRKTKDKYLLGAVGVHLKNDIKKWILWDEGFTVSFNWTCGTEVAECIFSVKELLNKTFCT